jgi:hypothetical protein
MKRSLMRQTRRWPQEIEQEVDTGSAGKKVLLALSWVTALAVIGIALYGSVGSGGAAAAFAAAGKRRPTQESEARLGAAHRQQRHNDCTLIVPANPLTAEGLATPYQLTASARGATNCHESTPSEAVFVQAAVLDQDTGQIAIYNPLVIDRGTQPAMAPVTPKLPAHAVVGIWFGANGMGLRLRGASRATLSDARCVNGLGASVFGQTAYCNAPTFFSAAHRLIRAGKLVPPPLGTGRDGLTCPTVRDFSVVDQDQSDNVTTTYRVTQDGHMAQNTSANADALSGSSAFGNGSDNRLLAIALDSALGCAPWQAPDLADPGHMVTALPLDELQAAKYQPAPVALVPSGDPMTLVNGRPNLAKQNLYRVGVDQPKVATVAQAAKEQIAYCQNLLKVAPTRLQQDRPWTSAAPSLDPAVADSLYTFLAVRLAFTAGPSGLNCTGLLHQASPVQLTLSNGVVVDATFTTTAGA